MECNADELSILFIRACPLAVTMSLEEVARIMIS